MLGNYKICVAQIYHNGQLSRWLSAMVLADCGLQEKKIDL